MSSTNSTLTSEKSLLIVQSKGQESTSLITMQWWKSLCSHWYQPACTLSLCRLVSEACAVETALCSTLQRMKAVRTASDIVAEHNNDRIITLSMPVLCCWGATVFFIRLAQHLGVLSTVALAGGYTTSGRWLVVLKPQIWSYPDRDKLVCRWCLPSESTLYWWVPIL